MNEVKNILLFLSLVLTLASCNGIKHKSEDVISKLSEPEASDLTQKYLVDYKKDTYKISLGDNYNISDKIVDWQWALLDDSDDKIDSAGKDSFLSLGEQLINYNDGDWLPSLHIETDKNIITSFTCCVLFDLADTINAEISFLRILSKDIQQLQNDDVTKMLIEKGVHENIGKGYIETFRLTRANEYEHNKFEYTVHSRKNGR